MYTYVYLESAFYCEISTVQNKALSLQSFNRGHERGPGTYIHMKVDIIHEATFFRAVYGPGG